MSALQGAAAIGLPMNNGSVVNGSPASNLSSPTGLREGIKIGSKRTRDVAGAGESPVSFDEDEDREARRIGVKRACNECRQQKLRCDVVQDPFRTCNRCRRLNLECKIDSSFKRVGKRSKNAEMEREIVELRRQLSIQQAFPSTKEAPSAHRLSSDSTSPTISRQASEMDQYIGSQEAVASLLDLRASLNGTSSLSASNSQLHFPPKRLEDVTLSHARIKELSQCFFQLYHPFLSLLDPEKSPDQCYEVCPLLFWTVMAVAARHYSPDPTLLLSLSKPFSRLLWSTLADVPQSHYVVKALCIICTWPPPISSTSSDPTFMLSGVATQLAMQIGLHRPSHTQDFSKFRVELREEELRDRIKTWAACTIVAQRVATGYGQPPPSLYDWTLTPPITNEASFKFHEELDTRLRIERFCNKVTKALYRNPSNPIGLMDDAQRAVLMTFLEKDFEELEQGLRSRLTAFNILYLRAAHFHLRLAVFFDSPTSKDYHRDLQSLWLASTSFLESAFSLETSAGNHLANATNYILQMVIAGGFTLLKLLRSFFADSINMSYGRTLFTRTISSIRTISVTSNDLPSRLAEVLAQLWRGGVSTELSKVSHQRTSLDNSLQLKVTCRMSMSLVFDSVWRWREEFQAKGSNLDAAIQNPTNPDSTVASSATSVVDHGLALPGMLGDATTLGTMNTYTEANYEVFDPLNWMFDGVAEFPYSFSSQAVDLTGTT